MLEIAPGTVPPGGWVFGSPLNNRLVERSALNCTQPRFNVNPKLSEVRSSLAFVLSFVPEVRGFQSWFRPA